MHLQLFVAIVAVAVPFASGYSVPASAAYGLDELAHAAASSHHGATDLEGALPLPAEPARMNHVDGQIQALNSNAIYHNMKNSEAIAESLAESNFASSVRQGNVNLVAPNVVDQGVFRSLHVPTGRGNHQVIATQPLPPIVVNQPGAPLAHISSGPAAVVKAAPVIYKIKPSVIYQHEVINKVPTPLSLNPVYVKVYKPGKKIDTPIAPVVHPLYTHTSYGSGGAAGASSNNFGAAVNAGPVFASPSHYGGASVSYAPAGY